MYPDPNLIPIEKISEENLAFTSGADVLTTAIAPSKAPSLFRIMPVSDTAAKFKVLVTPSGGSERTIICNSDIDLVADAGYIFDILTSAGDSVNFELDDSGNLTLFRVQEICYGG